MKKLKTNEKLMTLNRGNNMSKQPTKAGYWWWQYKDGSPAQPNLVIMGGGELILTNGKPITECGGTWLGPCREPGESFTVKEIINWIEGEHGSETWQLTEIINDPEDGIKAVTERNKKGG